MTFVRADHPHSPLPPVRPRSVTSKTCGREAGWAWHGTTRPGGTADRAGGAAAVGFSGVTRSYGAVRAVDGLDLEIAAGETVALLGRNGAGKSTTLNMLLGLLPPDAGTVRLFGGTPETAVRAGRVGAMLQDGKAIPRVTVRELITFVAATYPAPHGRHRGPGAGGPRRVRRAAGGPAVRRAGPAGPLRGGAGRQPRAAGARRADRGAGRRGAPRLLALDAGLCPPRQHHPVLHPLSGGGGRPRRPDRGDRPRPGGRRRQRRGDQAAGRRLAGLLRPRGRGRPGRCPACPA